MMDLIFNFYEKKIHSNMRNHKETKGIIWSWPYFDKRPENVDFWCHLLVQVIVCFYLYVLKNTVFQGQRLKYITVL